MYIFRNKIKLISPNRMHKHFGINHLDYEERKVETTEIADLHLHHLHGFAGQVRKHEIGRAFHFSPGNTALLSTGLANMNQPLLT